MELHWWLKEIPKACANIHLPKFDVVVHTDAGLTKGIGEGIGILKLNQLILLPLHM